MRVNACGSREVTRSRHLAEDAREVLVGRQPVMAPKGATRPRQDAAPQPQYLTVLRDLQRVARYACRSESRCASSLPL